MILSPSLLSADCGDFAGALRDLEAAGLRWVHWDVMDGRFVPNITFGQHLMIEEPERYLADFREAGADMLVVHAEAVRHLQRVLAEIRRLGMRAGVALNPATAPEVLEYVLDDVDMVLIMSVNPGFGGQKFLPSTFGKVRAVRAMLGGRACHVQVDGGVTPENAGELTRAGADVLVSGSSFFGHPPLAERLAVFRAAAE